MSFRSNKESVSRPQYETEWLQTDNYLQEPKTMLGNSLTRTFTVGWLFTFVGFLHTGAKHVSPRAPRNRYRMTLTTADVRKNSHRSQKILHAEIVTLFSRIILTVRVKWFLTAIQNRSLTCIENRVVHAKPDLKIPLTELTICMVV